MTRAITIALQIRGKGRCDVHIIPRWVGKNLAIHKPVYLDGNYQPQFQEESRGVWKLTHVCTGFSAGTFFGSFDRAKAFAREWDEAFAAVTSSRKVPKPLSRNYRAALAAANKGPGRKDIIEAGV